MYDYLTSILWDIVCMQHLNGGPVRKLEIYLNASFIHFRYLYSAPSRFLLRGAPDYSADTESEFHAEAHEQLRVKDLPRVPTRRLEVDSNPQPSGCKAPNIPPWGGFEPATLWLQGTEHTPTPPRPTSSTCSTCQGLSEVTLVRRNRGNEGALLVCMEMHVEPL